jgi:hypothetical protein
MGANYTIRLTSGDITGANYTIFFAPATTTNIATLLSNNSPATNITLAQLLIGVDVSVPDQSTKIIVSGDGYCEDSIEFPITPNNPVIPPVLCLFFENEMAGSSTVELNPYGIVNGKNAWRDSNNIYNLFYDNSVNPAKWTINLVVNTFLSNTTDEIPLSGWYSVGGGPYGNPSITSGVCPEICDFAIITDIDNSDYKKCNGIITVTIQNGTVPFTYYLDGTIVQSSNIFTNLCPGPHTIRVTDSSLCEEVVTVTVEENPQPTTYRLRVLTNETQLLNSETTLVTKNEWQIIVEPALDFGKTINFNLNLEEIGILSTPGTGIISKTITTYKNVSLLTPSITTSTSTGSRQDCNDDLPTQISGQTFIYSNVSMTVNDIVSGTTLSTLFFPEGGQELNGCVTKLNHDINYIISNLNIAQGIGTFNLINLNENGVLIDVEKQATTATAIPPINISNGSIEVDCETIFPKTVYPNNSNWILITRFYTNSTYTTPFNGESKWYSSDSNGASGGSIALRIDSNGFVTDPPSYC